MVEKGGRSEGFGGANHLPSERLSGIGSTLGA